MNNKFVKAIATGICLITFLVTVNSCKKDNNNNNQAGFNATLDGVAVNVSNTVNITSVQGDKGNNSDYVQAGGGWTNYTTLVTYAEVTMAKNFTTFSPSDTDYYSLYATGTYKFVLSSIIHDEGAEVMVTDGQGVTWSSNLGDNTGSTFKITSRGALNEQTDETTFSGTFNCKVYDGNGNHKTLNGSFNTIAPITGG